MKIRSEMRLPDAEFRHKWISEAAYFLAEKNHFAAGKALDDWLLAENKWVMMLICRYLDIVYEDGGLTVKGLQRLASSLGVEQAETIAEVNELVRAIQNSTGSEPCFKTNPGNHCATAECCLWKSNCIKIMAKWNHHAS